MAETKLHPPSWSLPLRLIAFAFDCFVGGLSGLVHRTKGSSYLRSFSCLVVRSLGQHDLLEVLLKPKYTKAMDVYTAFMISRDLKPEIIDLHAGSRGGWIGSSDCSKVLLYIHGGAYVSTCHPFTVEMLADVVDRSCRQGKDLGIFLLEYSLAPTAKYPTQLAQAAAALEYLLTARSFNPENILVGGESAGGNLVIALLSSIAHPHPAAHNISLSEGIKLGGAFLISPWVTFADQAHSMSSNKNKDFLNQKLLKAASDSFLGDAPTDYYNVPLSAPPEWWRDLPARDLYVIGGEYEIFLDDIVAWTDKVKVHNPQAEFYLEPFGVHVTSVLNRVLRLETAASEQRFQEWILERA